MISQKCSKKEHGEKYTTVTSPQAETYEFEYTEHSAREVDLFNSLTTDYCLKICNILKYQIKICCQSKCQGNDTAVLLYVNVTTLPEWR